MSWALKFVCAAFLAAVSGIALSAAQAGNTPDLESVLNAAREAQARSDFSAAAGYYRQAVKLSPNTAELWANLGLMDDLAGNLPEAIKSFTTAAHLNASMFVPQLFLGIDNLKLNHAEAAIPFLERALQINPQDRQVPLALGRAYALTGKGDRATDAYSRALTLAPDDGNAWLGLGMAALQQSSADDRILKENYKDSEYTRLRAAETFAEQGKLVQATDAYASLLAGKTLPPSCTRGAYGLVLMRQQEIDKAQAQFEEELKVNASCGLARLGLAGISLVQGNSESALKQLVALWNRDQGFLQESLPQLRDALSESQREQLLHMAEDLEAHGSTAPAEAGNAVRSEPDKARQAQAFYAAGQYRKCSESLRPHLSALSEPSLLLLAPCAFYTGDYKTASLAARRLKSMPAVRVNGLYWESKADQKAAITALSRAAETGANSPQLHVLLGDIYRQKQRWEEAELEYRKALDLDRHNQSASLGLALAYFSDGKSDQALEIDKALLRETPDDPDENLLAAEILVRGGRYTDAEAYLNRIHDRGQKFMPRVHTLLGEIYFATDRAPQAVTQFESALPGDDDGSIHYQLGRVYQKLGDKEKADEAFRISRQLRTQANSQ